MHIYKHTQSLKSIILGMATCKKLDKYKFVFIFFLYFLFTAIYRFSNLCNYIRLFEGNGINLQLKGKYQLKVVKCIRFLLTSDRKKIKTKEKM